MTTNPIEDEDMLAEPTVEYISRHSFTPIVETREGRFKNPYANIEQQVFEPDEDFYRSISIEEFKIKAREVVEKVYKRYTNERNNTTRNT